MNMPDLAAPMARPTYYPNVLAGQVALVTGANSGIGKAVAIGLGKAGADVIVNYVADEALGRGRRTEIEAAGSRAIAIKADVSKEAEVQAMFCQAYRTVRHDPYSGQQRRPSARHGIRRDDAGEVELRHRRSISPGQFLCAREAVREFKRRGIDPRVSTAAGKIICMSSVHEVIPWAGHVNYAASKGGIMQLMKSMAQELAPFRIRVNSVGPGAIRTPINRAAWSTPEAYAALMELVPYGRIGEPEDIAQAVVWLASDASDYVTGTTLFVDGGMTLYPGFATGG